MYGFWFWEEIWTLIRKLTPTIFPGLFPTFIPSQRHHCTVDEMNRPGTHGGCLDRKVKVAEVLYISIIFTYSIGSHICHLFHFRFMNVIIGHICTVNITLVRYLVGTN